MLTKLLTTQIPLYQDVIKKTIEKSMPDYEESVKLNLFRELMIGTAQCWLSELDNEFDGILLTQIREDMSIGYKTFTCICVYAPNKTEARSFIEGWETLKKFAKSNDCKLIDFYSSNPELIKYGRMFKVKLETKYFQLVLED